jgi:hypothetical protein
MIIQQENGRRIAMPKFKDKETGEIINAFKFGIDPIPDWFMDLVTSKKVVIVSNNNDKIIGCQNKFNMNFHDVGSMIVQVKGIEMIHGHNSSEFDELYERIRLMSGKIDEYGNLVISRIRKGQPFFIHMVCPFMSKDSKDYTYCGDRCPHFSEVIQDRNGEFVLELCNGKTLVFEQLDDNRERIDTDEEQN